MKHLSRWLFVALSALLPSVLYGATGAQQQQERSSVLEPAPVERAPVGAGTTAGATTGVSGPPSGNHIRGEVPPAPGPRLCERYSGEVREQCLQTVLRGLPIGMGKGERK